MIHTKNMIHIIQYIAYGVMEYIDFSLCSLTFLTHFAMYMSRENGVCRLVVNSIALLLDEKSTC